MIVELTIDLLIEQVRENFNNIKMEEKFLYFVHMFG